MISISERPTPFVQLAREAIETLEGPEALHAVCRLHADELNGWDAKYQGAVADAQSTSARLRTSDDMVRTLHTMLAAELLRSARLEAYNQQLGQQLSRVRTVTRTARDTAEEPVALVADIEAALSQTVDHAEFPPTIVAFVPEPARDRVGHFVSGDGLVSQGYPLVGWSLVVRHQATEPRRLEPTFLVGEQALAESTVRELYGLRLSELR